MKDGRYTDKFMREKSDNNYKKERFDRGLGISPTS